MQPEYVISYSQEHAFRPSVELYEFILFTCATLPVHHSLRDIITLILCSDEYKL
jgi:hypothetical protein